MSCTTGLCMVVRVFIQKRSYTWFRLIKRKYLWDLSQKIVWQLKRVEKSYTMNKSSELWHRSSGRKVRPRIGGFLYKNCNDHGSADIYGWFSKLKKCNFLIGVYRWKMLKYVFWCQEIAYFPNRNTDFGSLCSGWPQHSAHCLERKLRWW